MKKPLRLSPLAMTAALAALAALLLPLAGQEVLHTLAPLVLALLLGLAAALGWDRPNRPSHPLQPEGMRAPSLPHPPNIPAP